MNSSITHIAQYPALNPFRKSIPVSKNLVHRYTQHPHIGFASIDMRRSPQRFSNRKRINIGILLENKASIHNEINSGTSSPISSIRGSFIRTSNINIKRYSKLATSMKLDNKIQSFFNETAIKVNSQRGNDFVPISVKRRSFTGKRSLGEISNFLQQGLELLKRKEFANAVDFFTKAIQLSNNLPEAYFHRGISLLELNKPETAIKDLEKVVIEYPKYNKMVYLYLAMAYVKLANTASAISSVY